MATPKESIAERRKRDAKELALLIYDIFKESQTNGTVTDEKTD